MPEVKLNHSIYSSGYLCRYINPGNLKDAIDSTVKAIEKSNIKFDTIACRGISGLLVSPAVCAKLGVPPSIVRKTTEGCHSGYNYEGLGTGEKINFIVVDDGISTGSTLEKTIEEIKRVNPEAKFVGFFGYNQSNFSISFSLKTYLVLKYTKMLWGREFHTNEWYLWDDKI